MPRLTHGEPFEFLSVIDHHLAFHLIDEASTSRSTPAPEIEEYGIQFLMLQPYVQPKFRYLFLLVDAESGDIPVGILERSRVVVNIVYTSPASGSRIHISVTSPITAERQVDDNILRTKLARNVAARVNKRGKRSSPSACIDARGAVLNLERDSRRVARPEPDFDVSRGAFHGVPPSAVGVERGTVRVAEWVFDTAAGVAVDLPVAVGVGRRACLVTHGGLGAARGSVQGGSVGALVVDTLDDVNLTGRRPVDDVRGPLVPSLVACMRVFKWRTYQYAGQEPHP